MSASAGRLHVLEVGEAPDPPATEAVGAARTRRRRAVVEADPKRVPAVLAGLAGASPPADPAERGALLRELLSRPGALSTSGAARLLDEGAAARLFAR